MINNIFSERKQFNFYKSYYDIALEIECDKDRSDYLLAICEYQFTGIEPELNGMSKFAFLSQKHSLLKQVKGFEDAKLALKNKATLQPTPSRVCDTIPTEQPLVEINNKQLTSNNKEEEINNKKEKEYTATPSKFSFFNSLIDYGFDKDLVNDWIKVRKTKKATNTETAFKNFIKELEKRNSNINDVLEFIVSKNWSGFKWEWYDKENPQNNNQLNNLLNGKQIDIAEYTKQLRLASSK
jgi:hypothetical protein